MVLCYQGESGSRAVSVRSAALSDGSIYAPWGSHQPRVSELLFADQDVKLCKVGLLASTYSQAACPVSWPGSLVCDTERDTTYQVLGTSPELFLISNNELILDLSFTAFRCACCLGSFPSFFHLLSLARSKIPELQLPSFPFLVILLSPVLFFTFFRPCP